MKDPVEAFLDGEEDTSVVMPDWRARRVLRGAPRPGRSAGGRSRRPPGQGKRPTRARLVAELGVEDL